VQRIALARALHGDPRLLVLDDPQLDAEGIACLNAAVRAAKARGACVVVLAHRPIAIAECDLVLALDRGAQVAFGPRDAVLRDVVRGRTALVTAQAGAGP
jgi:ATP-binding cassette subfamily C protein